MSAFLAGFAKSLAGSIRDNEAEKRAIEAERRKIELMKEMEKWRNDNTVKESEFDPKTGQIVYYNASGNEMSRRPASQAQIDRYAQEKKLSDLEYRKLVAQANKAEFESDPEMMKEDRSLDRRAKESAIGYQGILGGQSSATTDFTREQIRRMRMENDALEKGEIPLHMQKGGAGGESDLKTKQELDAIAKRIDQRMSQAKALQERVAYDPNDASAAQELERITADLNNLEKMHQNLLAATGRLPAATGGRQFNTPPKPIMGQSMMR